jgi:hypothetical protein
MMTNNSGAVPASKKPRAYAPRWVSLIARILDGLYDETRSLADDNLTKRITLTSLKTLAKGIALSDGQRDALIGNIRARLGDDSFEWHGAIKLNRSQLAGAKKLLAVWESKDKGSSIEAGSAQDLPAAIGQLKARLAALEEDVAKLRLQSGVEVAPLLHNSSTNAANLAPNVLEQHGFSDPTKRNDTKRNHEVDMICLPGAMTAVDTPTASNDLGPSTYDNESGTGHEDEISRRPGENRIAVSYFRPDPSREPSAKLEIGDEKYNLIFHTAELTEERLRSACTAGWLSFYEKTFGRRLRAQTRGNPASDFRYVASPIYGAGDPLGYKKPVLDDCVAILAWGEDGQPEGVVIVAGDDQAVIPLRPSKLRTANAPTHKGSLRLAA